MHVYAHWKWCEVCSESGSSLKHSQQACSENLGIIVNYHGYRASSEQTYEIPKLFFPLPEILTCWARSGTWVSLF